MKAGSSGLLHAARQLARRIQPHPQHIEEILKSTPEVENTSRRTGMQLGLAAVTEANNGDFTVRLKKDRKRDIDDIIADLRTEIESTEPGTKIEFIQLLQDMIGDLTSAPEPVVIKLFAQDGNSSMKPLRASPMRSTKSRSAETRTRS